MVDKSDFGTFETAWCPGCGNHMILDALKNALADLDLSPHRVVLVSGIGQAAKTPHYLRANVFNGLHGRSLPVATGVKLANPDAVVIAESGDGCHYGEGGNHFLAALRRNIDITVLVHDNQIYGLTKGQASPTTAMGQVTKAQPAGAPSAPFNPVYTAVAMQAGFVARGFSGMKDHLAELIRQAVLHPGFSLVDILQPCVSFNRVNTFAWYKKRCTPLGEDYDFQDHDLAMRTALQWGETIPVGVIFKGDREGFATHLPGSDGRPLVARPFDREGLQKIFNAYRVA
jgi:2-oxoglutarate ferredoxin oxidoreductase subunit beta